MVFILTHRGVYFRFPKGTTAQIFFIFLHESTKSFKPVFYGQKRGLSMGALRKCIAETNPWTSQEKQSPLLLLYCAT